MQAAGGVQLPRPQLGISTLEARQASHGQASSNPGLPTGSGLTQPNRVDGLATGLSLMHSHWNQMDPA